MKICPNPFTIKQKMKALKRLLKALIFGKIKWAELKKFYLAMLHLERYLERLNSL
ncbi:MULTISPECIES: hypothetical protein [unclassified Acinetobacter]|uniref:hypothetical protein n=1 Tax=unclassified Acinetobacter TaxID=196816 RepID=UPI0015D18D5D|nr:MULTISPECIES: hypothetical protein [unclassified Acinetobacter]UNT63674.1 hypothetical protein IHE37_08090 [Acinetobacter towneri]